MIAWNGLALNAPWMLGLFLLPWLWRRLRPALPPRDEAMALPPALQSAATALSRSATGAQTGQAPLWPLVLLWLALALALAGPQRLIRAPDPAAPGRDIMLTLDLSGSMAIEDFTLDGAQVSRLDAVKSVASAFVRQRQGDRLGAVLFADRAYVAAPLGHDLTAVARAIDEAQIGITGRSTAISEGLGLAMKRLLAEREAAPKANPAPASDGPPVIVLLSDGRETGARTDALAVARLAAEMGLRIHTIALGPDDLESRPAARDGVDWAALRAIAETTGGRSYRVRSIEDLRAMARDLDALEPGAAQRPMVTLAQPLWPYPAALALGMALLIGLNPGRASHQPARHHSARLAQASLTQASLTQASPDARSRGRA